MNSLISITTDGQGSSVVSARELHGFLEVKARFNDWIKRRIVKYGFQLETDFVETEGVLLNSEYNPGAGGGRPETDYALTLDMAKQLAMVENNDKGNEARRYFINCERAALELARQQTPLPAPAIPAPSQTEQLLVQLVAGQQLILERLQADVDQIKAGVGQQRPVVAKRTPALPAPAIAPHLSLRATIRRKVTAYCERYEAEQTQAYSYLYKRLFEVYGVNVYRLMRTGKESLLDAVEKYGHLDRLYSLIEAELTYSES